MAARMNRRHQEMVREKIRAKAIVNRLTNFVHGKVEMSGAQVRAALGLLNKTLPDLQTVTHAGDAENPVVTQRVSDLVFDEVTDEALQPVRH